MLYIDHSFCCLFYIIMLSDDLWHFLYELDVSTTLLTIGSCPKPESVGVNSQSKSIVKDFSCIF